MIKYSAIQRQIDDATTILALIEQLSRVYPSLLEDSDKYTAGKYHYEKEEVKTVENRIDEWQMNSVAILQTLFSNDGFYKKQFEKTIVSPRMYYDAKAELKEEVIKGSNALKAILTAEELKLQVGDSKTIAQVEVPAIGSKHPLVFISHCSADKEIIGLFVEKILMVGLGLGHDEIAFTSEEGFGVEPGENIIHYIKDGISAASIVLIMISNHYKQSEVCMNEMGAAWALCKNTISVLLPNTDFSKLGWLTSFEKAIKINEESHLNSLVQKVMKVLSINAAEHFSVVSNKVSEFISVIGGNASHQSRLPKQEPKTNKVISRDKPLLIFDEAFNGFCVNEGEYIIRIDLKLRAEGQSVSLRSIRLKNKWAFYGSTFKPEKTMEFNTFIMQTDVGSVNDVKNAELFLKSKYPRLRHQVLDTTIQSGYNLSITFMQYFTTIRQCDGYDELQVSGWELEVLYNVNDVLVIPLTLIPLDEDQRGKYLNNPIVS